MRAVTPRLVLSLALLAALPACGARTGLHTPLPDGGSVDATADAPEDVSDAADDVFDAPPEHHVNNCQDAGITYIYLISEENKLLRFYPPSNTFHTIGTIACPALPGDTPFSMAVDRDGIAYVLFNFGELFRVSTLTASCQATGFAQFQNGFSQRFGMGFSSDTNDPGETLFVAGTTDTTGPPSVLATIDPATFVLSAIAPLSKDIGDPELTGTGDSRLFAFAPGTPESHLAEVDKTNANVLSDVLLDLQQSNITSWAFAFWGGDFYFFTSAQNSGTTKVNRYTPGGSTTPPVVAKTNVTIVGAGVSTCAPSK